MKKTDKKYNLSEKVKDTKVLERLIPTECANRQVGPQVPKYIVIHEVSLGNGRTPSNYNLQHYENKIIQDGLNGSNIGYHYLVSDNSIYHFIPDDSATKHTGTELNFCSIGIERLVNKDINFPDALHNQAKLTATLMFKWNIPIDNVISHKTARTMCGSEPKQCPSRMLAGWYGGFQLFYKEIKKCFENKDFFYEVLMQEQYVPQNNVDRYIEEALTLKKGL